MPGSEAKRVPATVFFVRAVDLPVLVIIEAVQVGLLFSGSFQLFLFGNRDTTLSTSLALQPSITSWGRLRADFNASFRRKMISNITLGLTFYETSQNRHSIQRLGLMSDLRRAVENDDLELRFQPQLHLETGAVDQAEVLLRWTHPRLEEISLAIDKSF